MNTSQAIREDPEAVRLLTSVNHKGRKYFDSNGEEVHLHKQIRKMGYNLGASNLSVLIARMNGTYKTRKQRQTSPEVSEILTDVKPLPKPKPLPKVILATKGPIAVTFPPIKETEYRGQHRTSYSFVGPDEFSIFAFDSYKEARREREKMRPLYLQAAIYASTHRAPSKGGRPAVDSDED